MMNIFDVNQRLKQRPPFQMIEKVLEVEPGKSAHGTKCVSVNEPWFMGHFPGTPMMPGVLLVETAAQLCSLVIENDGTDDKSVYVLLKVENFKFVRPVLPGDLLDVYVEKTREAGGLFTFEAKLFVEGQLRAKGSMSFTAVPKEMIFDQEK